MGNSAKVSSIDSINAFRVALVKFSEYAYAAITDAEAEITRTMVWLENEQRQHWQSQLRKRHDLVTRLKEAVRMKKLFKNAVGQYESAFDEEKALKQAMRQYGEAEEKAAATKRWVAKLQKEIHVYKGSVQRFSTAVQSDLPTAISRLERIVRKLEEYVALAPAAMEREMSSPDMLSEIFSDGPSMVRGGDERTPSDDEASSTSESVAPES
jgi:predicted alpha/beta hydrolase family esterase